MNNSLVKLFLLFAFTLFLSCAEEPDPIKVIGSSEVTISGAETGTINNSEVEFRYTIFSSSGNSESSISINIGKVGTTESVLVLILTDTDNDAGFEVDQVYNYQADPESTLIYSPAYLTSDNSYSINPETTEENWLKFTRLENTVVEGEFVINLENSNGDQVVLTGSFKALGSTLLI